MIPCDRGGEAKSASSFVFETFNRLFRPVRLEYAYTGIMTKIRFSILLREGFPLLQRLKSSASLPSPCPTNRGTLISNFPD